MIINSEPKDWKDLQVKVGEILKQCSFDVSIEKKIKSIRSNIEIDVYAEELINKRSYKILIECKMWKSNIPQLYVHGLRTVVNDIGANKGYIISTSNFQKGAIDSIENTNIELINWYDFQKIFFESWYVNYFSKELHFAILKNDYDPISIQLYDDFTKINKKDFHLLIEKYNLLNLISEHFPHHIFKEVPDQFSDIENKLPLEEKLSIEEWEYNIKALPTQILKEKNYSKFLILIRKFAKNTYSEMDNLNLEDIEY